MKPKRPILCNDARSKKARKMCSSVPNLADALSAAMARSRGKRQWHPKFQQQVLVVQVG
jgi:hypothetical protein